MRPLAAAALLAMTTACCPVAALKPVIDPPRIGELPTIHRSELACLSAETYDRLVLREVMLRGAFADCTTILEEITQ